MSEFCGVEVSLTMAINFHSLYRSLIRHYVGSGGGILGMDQSQAE
jgi:hypothetical protein